MSVAVDTGVAPEARTPRPAPVRGPGLFVLAFAAVLSLRADALHQPPVWDTAMGLFPAAIVLAENGFDVQDLLSRPGWAEGGPNIHPFSLVTWATALALRLSGDGAPLPLLHALHFAVAALTLVGVYRLAVPLLCRGLALGLAAAVLLFPLFLVQAGYLYTEMPLACATVWALVATVQGRHGRAIAFSALACFVKEAGVIVPAALAAAALLERGPAGRRAARVAGLLLAPFALVALQLVLVLPREAALDFTPPPYGLWLSDALGKLGHVPDLAVALGLFAGFAAFGARRDLAALRRGAEAGDLAARTRGLASLVVGAFIGFYLALPLLGVELYVLPRYYVQVAPLLLLGGIGGLRRLGGGRLAAVGLTGLALFFAANRSGGLGVYPPVPGNEFSLAERSLEYQELLAAQRDLLAAAAALPPDLPVFYGLPEHFYFAYPRMGYTAGPPARGGCLWLDPRLRHGRLADYPPRFALLYDFVGYGGKPMQALVRQARRDPSREVGVRVFRRGRYRTLLFEVQPAGRPARPRAEAPGPGGPEGPPSPPGEQALGPARR